MHLTFKKKTEPAFVSTVLAPVIKTIKTLIAAHHNQKTIIELVYWMSSQVYSSAKFTSSGST